MTRSDTRSVGNELSIRCPDCGCDLVVDAATGTVLEHRSAAPKKKGPKDDFDSLMARLDESKSKSEKIFAQELGALEDRDRLMDEKFKKAMERAESDPDDGPPVRPWDLD